MESAMKKTVFMMAAVSLSASVVAADALPAPVSRFRVAGLPAPVYYDAAHALEAGDRCEVAVVVVHGWGGGVKVSGELLPLMKTLGKAVGPEMAAPYVVAPLFPRRRLLKKHGVAEDGRAVWNDSWGRDLSKPGVPGDDWRGGGDAAGTSLSSFEVIDSIFALLGDRARYPALKRVVLTGFSAGGQFVGRYVAVGRGIVRDGVEVRYAAMAPSTELRLDPDVTWHYGIRDRPRYPAMATEAKMLENLSVRRVWRACGTKDVQDGGLDVCPAAVAQGANRYERFRNFETYLKRYPGWAKQVLFNPLEGLGHESIRAHTGKAFVEYVLGSGRQHQEPSTTTKGADRK